MMTFENFAIKEGRNPNEFLIIPHPSVKNFADVLNEFNQYNFFLEKGIIYTDIEGIIGDHPERYECYEIKKIMMKPGLKSFSDIRKEDLKILKKEYYNSLTGSY